MHASYLFQTQNVNKAIFWSSKNSSHQGLSIANCHGILGLFVEIATFNGMLDIGHKKILQRLFQSSPSDNPNEVSNIGMVNSSIVPTMIAILPPSLVHVCTSFDKIKNGSESRHDR
jgi:hypothetical protein